MLRYVTFFLFTIRYYVTLLYYVIVLRYYVTLLRYVTSDPPTYLPVFVFFIFFSSVCHMKYFQCHETSTLYSCHTGRPGPVPGQECPGLEHIRWIRETSRNRGTKLILFRQTGKTAWVRHREVVKKVYILKVWRLLFLPNVVVVCCMAIRQYLLKSI